MGFRGSRVQIPPSRSAKTTARHQSRCRAVVLTGDVTLLGPGGLAHRSPACDSQGGEVRLSADARPERDLAGPQAVLQISHEQTGLRRAVDIETRGRAGRLDLQSRPRAGLE